MASLRYHTSMCLDWCKPQKNLAQSGRLSNRDLECAHLKQKSKTYISTYISHNKINLFCIDIKPYLVFLLSLAALPANSKTSAAKYSITAAR